MKVLVPDTSVLIDLDRGDLVESTFRLPFVFTVPDLLYVRELRDHGGADLVRLGLRVEELNGDGVSLALGYRLKRKSLSLPDAFALALAKTNIWTLLSGDRELRQLAREEEVRCHGVLWMLDEMLSHGVADRNDLCVGLGKIADHPRCRLPKPEIRKRLLSWSVRKFDMVVHCSPAQCATRACACTMKQSLVQVFRVVSDELSAKMQLLHSLFRLVPAGPSSTRTNLPVQRRVQVNSLNLAVRLPARQLPQWARRDPSLNQEVGPGLRSKPDVPVSLAG